MAEAQVPVDLTNPGQVFACLGLMEAAEALELGPTAGGFDWCDHSTKAVFHLHVEGDMHPVTAVLGFLADPRTEAVQISPSDSKVFPVPAQDDEKTAPVKLAVRGSFIKMWHWAEKGMGRDPFKTFAGQQTAVRIVRKLLPALASMAEDNQEQLISDPFEQTVAIKGTFCFDARAAWDAISTGFSLDSQNIVPVISPAVEVLAPLGLSGARPQRTNSYRCEYAVWAGIQPLIIARMMLGVNAAPPGFRIRRFTAHLGSDKQYKKFFFAEEMSS